MGKPISATSRKKAFGKASKTELKFLLIWLAIKSMVKCLMQYATYLWQHNPLKIITQRQQRLGFVNTYGEVMIKPSLRERCLDVFLTDLRRRRRLLAWVLTKVKDPPVYDFSTCWQDGIVLCSMLESICPGICPSYHLLSPHHRVKNCRLGIKLANKYLYVPMDLLTPEEMAIAGPSTEQKIMQYVSVIKWASQNIKEKWTSLHKSLIAAKAGRCFTKGSGLRNGIVGRRSKFTIIVTDTIGVFNLLVEVRGPNSEYCGERIVSLHQAKGLVEKLDNEDGMPMMPSDDSIKYLEDGVGSTFVRRNIPPKFAADTIADKISVDFQCGEEGTFYVTFIPRKAGMHTVTVKWQNHQVEGSPFRVKVYKASNVSAMGLKDAHEKRVIYDSLSLTSVDDTLSDHSVGSNRDGHISQLGESTDISLKENYSFASAPRTKPFSKGKQLTVTRRRVLRRIITRNGEDIVIEEALSPSMSRQSSFNDNSDTTDDEQKGNVNPDCLGTSLGRMNSKDNLRALLNNRQTIGKQLDTLKEDVGGEDSNSMSEKEKHAMVRRILSRANNGVLSRRFRNDINPIRTSPETAKKIHKVSEKHLPTESNHVLQEQTIEKKYKVDKENKMDMDRFDQKASNLNAGNKLTTVNIITNTPDPRDDVQTTKNVVQKPKARRTLSDTPIYQLRRSLVSIMSLTDSDSTNSTNTSIDEPEVKGGDSHLEGKQEGTSNILFSPALKLVQSSSLKKACMYISQKAYTHTVSEDDFNVSDDTPENVIKRKLRITRSLPLARKAWKTVDVSSHHQLSVEELFNCIKEIGSDKEMTSDYDSSDNSINGKQRRRIVGRGKDFDQRDTDNARNKDAFEKHGSLGDESLNEELMHIMENGKKGTELQHYRKKKFLKSDHVEDHIKTSEMYMSPKSRAVSPTVGLRDKDQNQQHIVPLCRKSLGRGNLKRQESIYRTKSSGSGSESDRNSKITSKSICDSVHSINEPNVAFRSISVHKNPDESFHYTSEVHIVVPKAKVDKITQVSADEIKAETGWDILEGLHVFVRRISMKVPSVMPVAEDTSRRRQDTLETVDKKPNVKPQRRSFSADAIGNLDRNELLEHFGPLRLDNRPDQVDFDNERVREGIGNVSAWIERNEQLLNDNFLRPLRQATIETEDSGIAADEIGGTYHRQARHSFPMLRSPNGHVRLFRRPYRGQISLDPRLVRSGGEHNSGKEDKDEDGSDKDDDGGAVLERHAKRRQAPLREESFSMSDSELNSRSNYNSNHADLKHFHRRLVGRGRDSRTSTSSYDTHLDSGLQVKKRSKLTRRAPKWNSQTSRGSFDSSGDDISLPVPQEYLESTGMSRQRPTHLSPIPISKEASSSLDDSYCGFGMNQSERSELLQELDTFQNLSGNDEKIAKTSKHSSELKTSRADLKDESTDYLQTTSESEPQPSRSVSESSVDAGIPERRPFTAPGHRSFSERRRFSSHSYSSSAFDQEDIEKEDLRSISQRNLFENVGYGKLLDYIGDEDEEILEEDGSRDVGDTMTHFESFGEFLAALPHIGVNVDGSDDDDDGAIRVTGSGVTEGFVGMENNFQVWADNPRLGSLSVNICGPRPHTVKDTSVIYTGDNLYEVMYEVTQPGYYVISVKWAEENVPGSPFICKVTF